MFWDRSRTFRTSAVRARLIDDLNLSQERVSGFDLAAYQQAHVVEIGCGGVGSWTGHALVRKGVGELSLFDDDRAELKNLTRQLFSKKDLGKNKAVRLGRQLGREGCFQTTIHAYPYRFQEALERGVRLRNVRAVLCLVDNNASRVDASRFGLQENVPVVLAAVSRDALSLYVAVQEPGKACGACMVPQIVNDHSYPCNLPGSVDVCLVAAGLVAFVLDSLICGRHRNWNFRTVFLDGSLPDRCEVKERNPACQLCGSNSSQG